MISDPYSATDQEAWAAVKQWWSRYGQIITWAVIIGLGVSAAWHYWRQRQINYTLQASALYDQFSVAEELRQTQQAKDRAQQLQQQYPKTPYASLAAFWQAQQWAAEQRYPAALQQLEWVRQHTKLSRFRQLSRLRSARILLFQAKFQSALDLLATVDDVAYQPWVDEIKGDVYTAMHRTDAAVRAYRAATLGFATLSLPNPLLEMKLAGRRVD